MKNKGFIAEGLIGIVLGAGIAIVSVLIFFYVFKVYVDLQMREAYVWNKVQDVPMNLLSMDIDDESFVSRINKIYYFDDNQEKNQLKNRIDNIVSKQLFYYFEGAENPFEAVIKVNGIEISEYLEGCMILEGNCETPDPIRPSYEICHCYCSSKCGSNSNKQLTTSKVDKGMCNTRFSINSCKYFAGINAVYSAKFPFPLTFNGTDKFVDELSYDAVEVK